MEWKTSYREPGKLLTHVITNQEKKEIEAKIEDASKATDIIKFSSKIEREKERNRLQWYTICSLNKVTTKNPRTNR